MELAQRLYNILDPYELADTETTVADVARDIEDNPKDVIEYLINIIEEVMQC